MANDKAPKFEDTEPLFEETEPIGFVDMDLGLDEFGMPREKVSRDSAFMRGAEEGLTLGFASEIGSGLGAGMEVLSGADLGPLGGPNPAFAPQPGENKLDQFRRLYGEYRKINDPRYEIAAEEHPGPFTLGSIGGGLIAPIPGLAQLGKAPQGAGMLTNFMKGGSQLQGAAKAGLVGGTVIGAGMSPTNIITNPEQDLPQFANDVIVGGEFGTGLGVAMPVMQGLANVTGQGLKATGQMVAKPFKEGFKYGSKGELLVGSEAEGRVQSEITKFGKDLPKEFQKDLNELAKMRRQLIDEAQEAGVQVNWQELDQQIEQALSRDIKTNLPEVRQQLERFREVIKTAKLGPEVQRVRQIHMPKEGPTQLGQFAQNFEMLKQANPAKSLGTTADDLQTQLEKFQAEQRAIPGKHQPYGEAELIYEPMQSPGQQLGVIRQPKFDEEGLNVGYNKISSKVVDENEIASLGEPEMIFQKTGEPNTVIGIVRQPQLNKQGKVIGYKELDSSELPIEEAAQLKTISETVRSGGRDLQKPEELFRLYKDLEARAQTAHQDVQPLHNETAKGLKNLFRKTVPGTQELDDQIHTIKSGLEKLGIDETIKLDEKQAMERITNFVNQIESGGATGGKAKENLKDFLSQIAKVDPAKADRLKTQMSEMAEKAKFTKSRQLFGFYLPRPLATPGEALRAAGNITGLGVHKLSQKAPEELMNMATKFKELRASFPDRYPKTAEFLSKELERAANATSERHKNAILFGTMQNPAYRKMLQESEEPQYELSDEVK